MSIRLKRFSNVNVVNYEEFKRLLTASSIYKKDLECSYSSDEDRIKFTYRYYNNKPAYGDPYDVASITATLNGRDKVKSFPLNKYEWNDVVKYIKELLNDYPKPSLLSNKSEDEILKMIKSSIESKDYVDNVYIDDKLIDVKLETGKGYSTHKVEYDITDSNYKKYRSSSSTEQREAGQIYDIFMKYKEHIPGYNIKIWRELD